MNSVGDDKPSGTDRQIEVAAADLQAAWAVLEKLVASLDQIDACFASPDESAAVGCRGTPVDALRSYSTADLVQQIAAARTRLARHMADEDAGVLVESIAYWDYAGIKT